MALSVVSRWDSLQRKVSEDVCGDFVSVVLGWVWLCDRLLICKRMKKNGLGWSELIWCFVVCYGVV